MPALSEHLPTFGQSEPAGAFSQDALRRALAPALPKPASPASGAGAPNDSAVGTSPGAATYFKPLTAAAWKRTSPKQPAQQPQPDAQSDEDGPHTARAAETHGDTQPTSPRPAEGFAARIPHLGGVSPKQAEAAKIEAAVAKAQAEAAEAHAEALEAVRQAERERAEERIAEARQHWAEHEAHILHTALAGIKDEIMTELGDAVGEVLAPIFSDVCTHRALAEFHTALGPLMGDTGPPLVDITAPADLVDALRERLGDASHVRLTASDTPTLRAVADVTVVETSLERWSEGLSRAPTTELAPTAEPAAKRASAPGADPATAAELELAPATEPAPDDAHHLSQQQGESTASIAAEEPALPPDAPDQPAPGPHQLAVEDETATPHANIIAQEPPALTPDTSTADAPPASGDNDTSEER